jgi:dolichol-phosphate mannosyltransferase
MEVNEGLAAAVVAGARHASGAFVVVIDADLSHPPESIPQLLGPLVANTHDMVIGSRYCRGGGTPDWPLSRKISSRLATLPARFFADVQDPLAGFFAVRRERLAGLNRPVCGFKIGLEILATAEAGFRVTEIPIIFRDRHYGTSKMNGIVVLDYCRQLLSLLWFRCTSKTG